MITTEQKKWGGKYGWQDIGTNRLAGQAQLVLVFGGSDLVRDEIYFNQIRKWYPDARIVTASTAGEIVGTTVSDDCISLTAIRFDSTKLVLADREIKNVGESFAAGADLASHFPSEGLVHVMVFSDGLRVNGTALVGGLISRFPRNVAVTGGLVGDGSKFMHTYVGVDGPAKEGNIVAIGFYSKNLKVGYGSLGGWDSFGPERKITKSKGNILYELDGQSALELYKNYLGEKAAGLPGTGLLFPLSLRIKEGDVDVEVVRTLLAINEKDGSMTFAGDMPEGVPAKLMKANFERLVDGASGAAEQSLTLLKTKNPQLGILISCIGRKLVLQESIEDELDAVRYVIGDAAAITGFYSYGEICPSVNTEKQCQLHNQTMTITLFYED